MMTVVELARRVGVTPDTVRHYLRIGLLQAKRHSDNDYRLFEEDDVTQLCFVHHARMLGFSLKEIAEIVAASKRGDTPCPKLQTFIAKSISRNRHKLEQFEHLQASLNVALKDWNKHQGAVLTGHDAKTLITSMGIEWHH